MEKVIKNGQVAVLITPRLGLGWSTSVEEEDMQTMLFDPDIVNAVLEGDRQKAYTIAKTKCSSLYSGDAASLEVVWVPQGTAFVVVEYDGEESILTTDDLVNVA